MKFRAIAGIRDIDVQRGLARVPDGIIAASLQGAPGEVAAHILKNISERRRRTLASMTERVPDRTVAVAREQVVKALAGPIRTFMEKLADRHPVFVEARRRRKDRLTAEHLLRMVRES